MKLYYSTSLDPFYNLAIEEFFLKKLHTNKDIYFFYRNEPSVIVGRNQVTLNEINYPYIEKNSILVARRISGGGAVYHNKNNINFSFIKKFIKGESSQKDFLKPIIDFLKIKGINVEFKGRNDLLVNGKKISGSAQYIYKNKIMHHGTLLFDVDVDVIVNTLNPSKKKIQTKGIKSIKQRVTNIKSLLKTDMVADDFYKELIDFFISLNNTIDKVDIQTLDSKYQKQINDIVERNRSWNWVYGSSPDFTTSSKKRFPGGEVCFSAVIERGIINNIKFTGDFLSSKNITDIEEKLIGIKFKKNSIMQIFHLFDFEYYFNGITKKEILGLLIGE